MTTKTEQETFDIVVSALLKQGQPSLNAKPNMFGSVCAYRGEGGTKCAAGHLIPDAKYNPSIEGAKCYMYDPPQNKKGERVVTVMTILKEEGYNPEFVAQLQLAHDSAVGDAEDHEGRATPERWMAAFRFRVRRLAQTFNLSMDKINQEFPL